MLIDGCHKFLPGCRKVERRIETVVQRTLPGKPRSWHVCDTVCQLLPRMSDGHSKCIYSKLHISRIWWDLEKNPSYVKIRVMWNVYGFTSKCKDKIVAIKQTSFLWKLSSEKANLRMNEWCSSLRMTGYQLNGFIFSLDWFFAYEIAVHVWTDKINSSKKTVAVSIFFTATFHKHPFCLQNNA